MPTQNAAGALLTYATETTFGTAPAAGGACATRRALR